ncbi:MAG: hypothetical protein SF052_04685 [Bacteroidia bacterium]|nr:hypothetical protein [Bacteroidia bacterium]
MKKQLLLILLLFPAVVAAQNDPGYITAFMPLVQSNPDAVLEGMGGLGVVLPENMMGNHSRMNPALLYDSANITRFQIHYNPELSSIFTGFHHLEGNLSFSLRPRHRISAVLGGFNLGWSPNRNGVCPPPNPSFSQIFSTKVGIQYGWKINRWLSVGAGLYGVQSRLTWVCEDNPSVTRTLAGEWGLQFQKALLQSPRQELWLRAAVSQTAIGPKLDFFPGDTGLAAIGPIWRAGAQIEWKKKDAIFAGISAGYQMSYIPGYRPIHTIGLQETLNVGENVNLYLRQGVNFRSFDAFRGGFAQISTGIGVEMGYFRIDASMLTPLPVNTHISTPFRISMTYSFGK